VGFFLFILVTAILIIRPMDYFPGLEYVQLYVVAIVPCIIVSFHKLIPQLTMEGMRERPVLVLGIGIVLVSLFSSLLHGRIQEGFDLAVEFVKILLFYLLLLAHVDSPGRLKLFFACLVGIILIPTLLAVLNFHGYLTVPGITIMRGEDGTPRLATTGTFSDPNDVCELFNCAMILCLYGLLDPAHGLRRVLWLAPIMLFGHALALTQSRGGFLGAAVGVTVLVGSRFRGKKALMLAGAALALCFYLFGGGRQTSIGTKEGTSQLRIQNWDSGFAFFLSSPLIGIGPGEFVNANGNHAAHNAFVGTYAELGFFGGTLLFGQYFYCLKNLAKLAARRATVPNPVMRGAVPALLACLASYATSEMSLNNSFGLVTYLTFGLASVGILLSSPSPPLPDLLLSGSLVRRIILYSGLFLVVLYIFVRSNLAY
jgi:hypothetical protein